MHLMTDPIDGSPTSDALEVGRAWLRQANESKRSARTRKAAREAVAAQGRALDKIASASAELVAHLAAIGYYDLPTPGGAL